MGRLLLFMADRYQTREYIEMSLAEVGDQEGVSAQDVTDISSRLRIGYKTTVSVWRNQAKRDVQMVLKNE